ncbi:hypothetical protein [Pseudomonas chlororaphis]|uniref:hypothetical protein n=1 Tax=Pseudomonas chlororaphis TaxID=587753 RepID=UPI000F58D9D4|nr:hypothetical protein [Pseudomonas chlororaphis]AZC52309.1 hypothetical protein C4K35_4740 [Pseudomonas chlororaphis subsp. piscium]WDG45696.1 hypothetical protein PUP58_18200 [Pseudomonas chlororaphis]
MDIQDGGPAFPVADFDHQIFQPATTTEAKRQLSGMSLRDYFAAKAIPAAWAAFDGGYFDAGEWESINQGVAVCAYQMADAMLAARSA